MKYPLIEYLLIDQKEITKSKTEYSTSSSRPIIAPDHRTL